MPTITPQVRAVISSNPENFQQPRRTITQSTGMGPKLDRSAPPKGSPGVGAVSQDKTPQSGQPVISDSAAPAVTLSPQLTALARQQQKLQQSIQAQREKEAAWEKEKAAYIPKDSLKAKAQQNAAEALQEALGLSYEELANLMITQQNGADPVQALAQEVKQLKTAQEENVNKQYEATIKQYKSEATALVAKDPKKYFLINKEGAQDAIVQHIVDTWEENPDKVLTVEDAANDIEEFLKDEAKKYKSYIEELEGKKEEIPAQGTKTLPPPQKSEMRTLSNSVESGIQTRINNQFQHLSMKERIAAAIARSQK